MDEAAAVEAKTAESTPFDLGRLADHCRMAIPEFAQGLEISRIKGGSSNPTFMVTAGGRRFILRKKPEGPLLPSAHQVEREHKVMAALGQTDVPVPRMRLLCEDASVIGTPFYIMEFVEGRIFRDARLPGMTPGGRAAIYDEANAVLARLHAIDPAQVGLAGYGPPGNYFERQIRRWTSQYRAAESETIPAMEALIRHLPTRIPADDSVGIAHGDYRLENMIFHPTEPRLLAILDWELSTLGHPLADLAYSCIVYHSTSETFGTLRGINLAEAGIPDEAAHVKAYCDRTGRADIEDWEFYLAFSIFRLASIGQGVYRRAQAGMSDAARSGGSTASVWERAETAWAIASRVR